MKLFAKLLKPAMLLCAMLSVSACVKPTGFGATDGACRAFSPISWSASDTDETIRDVKAHNAAHKAACGGS